MLFACGFSRTNDVPDASLADPGVVIGGLGRSAVHPSGSPIEDCGWFSMRLARVLLPQSPATSPVMALERDGCLYEVAELERRLGLSCPEDALGAVDNFFARVFALGGAGLDALDDRLFTGHRPTEARLAADEVLWQPPCLPERALWVALEDASLRYRIGNARALLGHQASVPFPPSEPAPELDVSIAALLGDELRAATAAEAERAIVGYAILLGFYAPLEEQRRGPCRARDFGATLGPVLVTKDEAGSLEGARARLRVGDEMAELDDASALSLAESIAFVSQHVTLAPGDVVSGVPLPGAREAARRLGLAFGATIEVAIDPLGKVAARPVRGPEPPSHRRS